MTLESALSFDTYKSLAEVDGKPAAVYVVSPAPDTYEVIYAYASVPEPNNAADWTPSFASCVSLPLHYYNPCRLVDHAGLPAFTYWSSEGEHLYFARASTATPELAVDWTVSLICEAGVGGNYSALADWQDYPLVVYSGLTTNYLHCAHAEDWQVESLAEWEQHMVEDEGDVQQCMSIAQLPSGIGVAYRDWAGERLLYAWFSEDLPHGAGDWCVMEVASGIGPSGASSVVAMANGMPAIVYGYPGCKQLWLATMVPPY